MTEIARSLGAGFRVLWVVQGVLVPAGARAQVDPGKPVPGDAGGAPPAAQAAAVEPPDEDTRHPRARYELDIIADSIILGVSIATAVGSELTINSGELGAQQPGETDNILFLDRWVAETDTIDEQPGLLSDIGLYGLLGYAVVDSVVSGINHGTEAGLIDFTLYAEAVFINWSAANIMKLAMRRPRPRAYVLKEMGRQDELEAETNQQLSFYSAHTSVAAGVAATASYFALRRDSSAWQSWTLLGVSTAVVGFIGVERIETRAHFPTDVIAGFVVGAAVGVLVPHVHRISESDVKLGAWTDGRTGAAAVVRVRTSGL